MSLLLEGQLYQLYSMEPTLICFRNKHGLAASHVAELAALMRTKLNVKKLDEL